jgi:hypothetical protein
MLALITLSVTVRADELPSCLPHQRATLVMPRISRALKFAIHFLVHDFIKSPI